MSTAIMNMALDLLDEEAILSETDDRTAVRWMNRNFPPVRDSLLRLHPWNFAKKRAALAARVTGPSFGFSRAYPKPSDCLRVLPLESLGNRNGCRVDFAVEGPDILTNAGAPLRILYIARIEDDGAFDPLFTQYLAATLATRAANYVTGKQSYAERVGAIAKELLLQAQMVNALEGVPEDAYQDDWVSGRQIGVGNDYDDGYGYGDSGSTTVISPPAVYQIQPTVNASFANLDPATLPRTSGVVNGVGSPRWWLNVDTLVYS